jgi:pyridoxine 4-dehydrogenase
VHDNLRNLGLDSLDIVNLRVGGIMAPSEGSIEEPLTVLAELKREGLIRRVGVSNVSPQQLAEAQAITEIVCVQNMYNVANRNDDGFIEDLTRQGIAYVPFFPAGGLHSLAVVEARRSGGVPSGHANAGCSRVASSALAQRPADSRYFFRPASS